MQTTQAFFDRAAATWDKRCQCKFDAINRIISLLEIKRGQSVLDVGTGTGILLPFLLPEVGATGSVTALDLSPEMLTMARRKFGSNHNARFRLFDIERGSLAGRYDRIILFNMYPHLATPYETIVKLVRHNLRRGGILTIAHYPGRTFINAIHRQKTCDVYSEALMPIGELATRYASCGLSIRYAEDTTDFYILQLQCAE
jgi:demethylmenaquinone methyltransferase/2-methoxy-6-polyprenyl-1,4-benzoquinol methylase